jgi:alpha-glucosidase
LPFPPRLAGRSAAEQRADESSILHLYRDLLRARRGSDALRGGDQVLLDAPEGVLGWSREAADGDRRIVLVNFTDADVSLAGHPSASTIEDHMIEISSDRRGEGRTMTSALTPNQAVVLRSA